MDLRRIAMSATAASPVPGAVPFGNLPPLQLAMLPVFVGLFAYVGPGILWAALAQAGTLIIIRGVVAFLAMAIISRRRTLSDGSSPHSERIDCGYTERQPRKSSRHRTHDVTRVMND
jgi:hypothetical protein